MKIGQTVVLINTKGTESEGTIEAVTGSGESGWKRLSIRVGKHLYEDVPNALDSERGHVHWTPAGQVRTVEPDALDLTEAERTELPKLEEQAAPWIENTTVKGKK